MEDGTQFYVLNLSSGQNGEVELGSFLNSLGLTIENSDDRLIGVLDDLSDSPGKVFDAVALKLWMYSCEIFIE